jgi:hypothetical protein
MEKPKGLSAKPQQNRLAIRTRTAQGTQGPSSSYRNHREAHRRIQSYRHDYSHQQTMIFLVYLQSRQHPLGVFLRIVLYVMFVSCNFPYLDHKTSRQSMLKYKERAPLM